MLGELLYFTVFAVQCDLKQQQRNLLLYCCLIMAGFVAQSLLHSFIYYYFLKKNLLSLLLVIVVLTAWETFRWKKQSKSRNWNQFDIFFKRKKPIPTFSFQFLFFLNSSLVSGATLHCPQPILYSLHSKMKHRQMEEVLLRLGSRNLFTFVNMT